MDHNSASKGGALGVGKTKATTTRVSSKDQPINGDDRPRSFQSGSKRPFIGTDDVNPASRYGAQNGTGGHAVRQGVKRRHVDDDPGRRSYEAQANNGSRGNGSTHSDSADVVGTKIESEARKPEVELPAHAAGRDEAEVLSNISEERLIEERRKRREALRAKLARSTTSVQKINHANAVTDVHDPLTKRKDDSSNSSLAEPATRIFTGVGPPVNATVNSPQSSSPSTTQPGSPDFPLLVSFEDDSQLANGLHDHAGSTDMEGPSAADYDPAMDMQEDRKVQKVPATDLLDKEKTAIGGSAPKSDAVLGSEDDEFDMFAADPLIRSPEAGGKAGAEGTQAVGVFKGRVLDQSMLHDWDDSEGYYRIILGELLDKRYHVETDLGKGVFSAVVRATDNNTGKVVAIKIIRRQESMFKAGLKEIRTLQKLAEADVEDKRHMIRLERHFMHKGHLCMVFEHMSINLREVLKKFGRDIGINIKAVRAYAQQMFLGLSLLKKCEIIHADLKPDNVLVNENRSQLKIADLGSAFEAWESEVTGILVSRFYRAPEVMLGLKGDYALDMWSVGCTLFELYTGRICFTGSNNNQMLKAIMECRGKIPNRVLKKAEYWEHHFDADGTFLSQEYDPLSRREVIRRMNINRAIPAKEIRSRVFASARDLSIADTKELNLFADLLDKCLAIDPARRITPHEALRHGFISRTTAQSSTPVKGPVKAPIRAPIKAPIKAKGRP